MQQIVDVPERFWNNLQMSWVAPGNSRGSKNLVKTAVLLKKRSKRESCRFFHTKATLIRVVVLPPSLLFCAISFTFGIAFGPASPPAVTHFSAVTRPPAIPASFPRRTYPPPLRVFLPLPDSVLQGFPQHVRAQKTAKMNFQGQCKRT